MDESTQSTPKSKNNLVIIGVIVIAVIALLGVGGYAYTKMGKETVTVPSTTPEAAVTPSEPATMANPSEEATAASSSYKNGEFVAVGNYTSPGGAETVKVAVTLKDGVITALKVTPQATRPNSVKFQGLFAAGAPEVVVGKNIDEVKLDKVGGSSLTPMGFNDALDQIKTQAQS